MTNIHIWKFHLILIITMGWVLYPSIFKWRNWDSEIWSSWLPKLKLLVKGRSGTETHDWIQMPCSSHEILLPSMDLMKLAPDWQCLNDAQVKQFLSLLPVGSESADASWVIIFALESLKKGQYHDSQTIWNSVCVCVCVQSFNFEIILNLQKSCTSSHIPFT